MQTFPLTKQLLRMTISKFVRHLIYKEEFTTAWQGYAVDPEFKVMSTSDLRPDL